MTPTRICTLAFASLALIGAPVLAAPVSLPQGAEETAHQAVPNGDFALPTGPWAAGKMTTQSLTGAVETWSWRIPGAGADSTGLMQLLTDQLRAAGYAPLFQCQTAACGGFDFRYAVKSVPEPEMHVDLGDFRFLAAARGPDNGAEHVTLLVSHAGDTGFVQLSHIGPADAHIAPALQAAPTDASDQAPRPASSTRLAPPLAERLEAEGSVELSDLAFDSGSADLGPGPFPSLAELADYLENHPDRQVVIVGHTDATGTLAMNVSLSRQRAQSVVDRLVSMGVPAAQLSADGVGYLAPVASNLTDAGRQKNRRVEAVLASTR